jgi:galactokinase
MRRLDRLEGAFAAHFGHAATWRVTAPGRINLIGEHTDYNGGLVLPAAIDLSVMLAASPCDGDVLRVRSIDLEETVTIDLKSPKSVGPGHWSVYPAGVASELLEQGFPLHGAACVMGSTLPMGSGLSSSAAVEMAFLRLFEALAGEDLMDTDAALLGQRVEHRHAGVNSGLMDQLAVRCGRAGEALLIDCATNTVRRMRGVPLGFAWVVADTGAPRTLAGSAYNQRVQECGAALSTMNRAFSRKEEYLSGFSEWEVVEVYGAAPGEVEGRRARHVVSENARVLAAAACLEQDDASGLGMLLNASHESLRQDYEVSSLELDTMAAAARALPGCAGARMTGAGFGGCTLQLVAATALPEFVPMLARAYEEAAGLKPRVWPVGLSDGATAARYAI